MFFIRKQSPFCVFFRQPREQLIAATKSAKNTIVTTDFFRYLAELPGFVLDDVSAVYQFRAGTPFKDFIDGLVKMREDADKDPKLTPLAVVAKLTGNASYGSFSFI